jgi:hypothetical protein
MHHWWNLTREKAQKCASLGSGSGDDWILRVSDLRRKVQDVRAGLIDARID